MQPGIYHDVPEDEYHALPYCSKHALDVILERSPAHLLYQRQHPEPATPALIFGRAFHTYMLDHDNFAANVKVTEMCCAKTKSGKPCSNGGKFQDCDGSWFCGTHAQDGQIEPEAIHYDDMDRIQAMYRACMIHDAAASLLYKRVETDANEVTAIFDWPELIGGRSLRCKARADIVRPGWATIADIKTTDNANERAFAADTTKYGYYRQAAFYLTAFQALGVAVENFVLIAVEKEQPHAVACYPVSASSIEDGLVELQPLLRTYAECVRTDKWPAFDAGFKEIQISGWKSKSINAAAV